MRIERSLAMSVRQRARRLCEYCRFPESESVLPFVVDHIRSQQHRGKTTAANLALACSCCNRHKGPNLSGVDPRTERVVRLYNPRRQRWQDHFRWKGARIVGLTATGRATVHVLAMNEERQILART